MNILLIHQIFATPEDGGGTRHFELARCLVGYGHKITVITGDVNYLQNSRRDNNRRIYEGIEIIYVKIRSNVHKSLISRAFNFLSFSIQAFFRGLVIPDVDLVWTTSPPLFQAFAGLLLALLKRKHCVFEVRDLWIDFAVQLGILKSPFAIKFLKTIEGILYNHSSLVMINSPGFIPYIPKSVPSGKVHLVPNGVITADFNASEVDRNDIRSKHSLVDSFVVMYLGNVGIANDMETIIAAAKILEAEQAIKVLIVGGGMEFKKLQQRMGDSHNVRVIGAVPKKDVGKILAASDVCIATLKDIPLFGTVYPNKVFDYMAAKKPTIIAIKGVAKDIIESSKGGVCVEPGSSVQLANAVLYYYKNPGRCLVDGEAAYKYVKTNFERATIAEKLNADVISKLK